jgi:hypothetical protein
MQNIDQAIGGTFVLSKAGLGVGSTNTQLSTGAITVYVIDGIFQTSKAATATFPATITPGQPAAVPVPVGNKCAFGVWLDKAGVFTVTQGQVTPANSNTDKAPPPPAPGDRALVGVFTAFALSAPFVLGTNVLTAGTVAGVTVNYFDTFSLPGASF